METRYFTRNSVFYEFLLTLVRGSENIGIRLGGGGGGGGCSEARRAKDMANLSWPL